MPDDPTKDGTGDDMLAAEEYQEQERIFQDATETNERVIDPITIEEQGNDDPTQILGIDPEVAKEEYDKRAYDGTGKPSGSGEPRLDDDVTMYEGNEDDLRAAQEDAFDQASDELESQDGPDTAGSQ